MIHRLLIMTVLLTPPISGVLWPPTARSASPLVDEVRAGALYHDAGVWSGTSKESGIDYNVELIFSASWKVLGGIVRPNLGLSLNDRGGTDKLYGGGVYEYAWDNGMFIDLAFGFAFHDGEIESEPEDQRNQLGSRILFRVAIEPGFTFAGRHRLSLMFDHASNAYLVDPNEGLDTLGLRYGFRF